MTPVGSAPAVTWFDTHCHIHDEEDPAGVFERARSNGIERMILIGTGPVSSLAAVKTAALLGDGAYASVGLHPHDASTGTGALAAQLGSIEFGRGPVRPGNVVAVGECGLDYYYEHSPREAQRRAFVEQIALARTYDLTLVVHTRDAWEETLSLLGADERPERIVIHCFTGGVEEARACLELGAFLSFSGILTFKSAEDIRAAARFAPADRILVETDSPYLAPVPHRGKRNEPAYVALVGAALAELRGIPVGDLAGETRENTLRAFNLAR